MTRDLRKPSAPAGPSTACTTTLTPWYVLSLPVLSALACVAACGSDDPKTATFVTPLYADACNSFGCSDQGVCTQTSPNVAPSCACMDGFAGVHCERCDRGFHRDAEQRCVPDKRCGDDGPNPCGTHGVCKDDSGVVECSCNTGYQGARCNLCMPGYALDVAGDCLQKVLADGQLVTLPAACTAESCHNHGQCSSVDRQIQCACYVGYVGGRCEECANDYDRPKGIDRCIPTNLCDVEICGGCNAFDGGRDFPNSPDTCLSSRELQLDGVKYASTSGEGTLWLCAPSRRDGLMTEHLALEAGSLNPAEITFGTPVVRVSFDLALWDTEVLEVLADEALVQSLKASRYVKQLVSLTLPAPTRVLGFRSIDGYTRSFAIDNVVYESESSTCK